MRKIFKFSKTITVCSSISVKVYCPYNECILYVHGTDRAYDVYINLLSDII